MAPAANSKQRDYDYLFKLVLIGDSGVGKSCLLLRFAVSSILAPRREVVWLVVLYLTVNGLRPISVSGQATIILTGALERGYMAVPFCLLIVVTLVVDEQKK